MNRAPSTSSSGSTVTDQAGWVLEQPTITPDLARAIVGRAERISGVRVDADKTDFVRLRVGRRLRALGMDDFAAYLALLERDDGTEVKHLVESLTTHTTSFFRERLQYDWLEREGLDLLDQDTRAGPVVVWSAAASLGAELWSAGMLLQERNDTGKGPLRWQLIGTDISSRILARAESATYTEDEINGLSQDRRERFLLRSKRNLDANIRPVYRISQDLRRNARFEQANLQRLNELAPFTADIAFLRNVLIYFSEEDQTRVVEAVISRIRPGGVLLTGHAETLKRPPGLETVRPTIYRKV